MMNATRAILAACLLWACASGCSTTTVILVRHAEKAAQPANDPPLTAAGQARAHALAQALQHARIGAVYASQYQRTQQTAQPTAAQFNLNTTVFNVQGTAEQHAQALVQHILEHHTGKAVLVVGHSNTVPALAAALGAAMPAAIASNEFDRILIVLKKQKGSTRLIEASYGP